MTIHVGVELQALIEKLGFDYTSVRKLTVTPDEATVEFYLVNDEGHKYIEDEKVATAICSFKIRS